MKVIEGKSYIDEIEFEDAGCAAIVEIELDTEDDMSTDDGDRGMFLRIQSWDELSKYEDKHKIIKSLLGKTIKVTIEIED